MNILLVFSFVHERTEELVGVLHLVSVHGLHVDLATGRHVIGPGHLSEAEGGEGRHELGYFPQSHC